MRIAVVGQGYVGVTGAVALAQAGHLVTGIEQDRQRLEALALGRAPVVEPGLQDQLSLALASGRLAFAGALAPAHAERPFDAVLITVGSPPAPDGTADLRQVTAAVDEAAALTPPTCVVLKSTVPPGTSDRLLAARPDLRDRFASNPEFLNQGSAMEDWTAPSRLVVGVWSRRVLPLLRSLYDGVICPWVVTTPASAEMAKYASNTFLAAKISFANEIARLCSAPGFDVDDVMQAVGYDPRIGHAFLQPGLGFGDSCLPKDTLALARWAAGFGVRTPLLDAVIEVNATQPGIVLEILRRELGQDLHRSVIAVLGARYEPWSDDMRAAPSLTLVPALVRETARVRIWDPAVGPDGLAALFPGTEPVTDLRAAVREAHAAVILTEWPEVVESDWTDLGARLARPRVVVDGKNCLRPWQLARLPLRYRGIGNRPAAGVPDPAGSAGISGG
ncbi:UDP-glucose dehydrogenase family protein [Streptomyces sp. URMC 126]|uniref:UDP-glucose dehydrogenase family protein n=1 Tax=Streptomyces sp. URMC 126 TaxID=3423401 RepID=UPI003F1BE8C0